MTKQKTEHPILIRILFLVSIFSLALATFFALTGLASAELVTCSTFMPTIKTGECIDLIQTCATCSYVNVTTVFYPPSIGTISNLNDAMTQFGTVYNYTFCETSTSGTYWYSTVGDPDGFTTVGNVCFNVTPSGDMFGMSDVALYLIVFVISIFVLSFFFYRTLRSSSPSYKGMFCILTYFMFLFVIFLIYRVANDYLFSMAYLNEIIYYVLLTTIILAIPVVFLGLGYMITSYITSNKEAELRKRGHSDESIERRMKYK